MFLARCPHSRVHVVGIADLRPLHPQPGACSLAGGPVCRVIAGSCCQVAPPLSALAGIGIHPAIDIVVECTGDPVAAVAHAVAAFSEGKHVINATVEADAFCGPALAASARDAGVIYSMAYGDQPALTCDLVDWARTCGFTVVAAGRGHKWLPEYRFSTPETIWDFWGLTAEQAARGRLNPKMFNSFLDGSKPAIESAAIANATGLGVPEQGLAFPPGGVDTFPI